MVPPVPTTIASPTPRTAMVVLCNARSTARRGMRKPFLLPSAAGGAVASADGGSGCSSGAGSGGGGQGSATV
eukprot:4170930-Prymnesium_polylepis.1